VTFRETPGSSQCFIPNSDRGIEITIHNQSALLADECTITQVLVFIHPTTTRTSFAGGIPAINENQMGTLPGSFVLKLASDFSKVAIRDGLSELVIFEHACYMQVLNGYQGVVFAEIAGEFVCGILADVSNVGMLLCQFATAFLAVLAAFLAPGLLPL
jgi:hypothetical protein